MAISRQDTLANIVTEDNANDPLIKKEGGSYTMSDKNLCLIFLEVSARQTDTGFTPHFELMSKTLGVPKQTLHHWWQNRKEIQKTAGQTVDLIPSVISQKLKFQVIKALEEVEKRGFDAFSNQDLIKFIKEAIQISRLLDNLSTSNIAVRAGTDYSAGHVSLDM